MTERLILVRHGETLHNVAGIAQGWNDSDLSEKGRRQVRALAQRLTRYEPTAIYSSPLGRALSTANEIAATTGLPVQTLDDLREMSYGGWEGKSFLDVRRDDLELYRRWIADPDCRCPDGESHNDVLHRMERAFAEISGGQAILPVGGGQAILPVGVGQAILPVGPGGIGTGGIACPPLRPVIVTHGTAIRIGATALLNAPVKTSQHLAQDNAALNLFFRRGERWILKLWNDTTHCVEPE